MKAAGGDELSLSYLHCEIRGVDTHTPQAETLPGEFIHPLPSPAVC